jgi:hypothetical protein
MEGLYSYAALHCCRGYKAIWINYRGYTYILQCLYKYANIAGALQICVTAAGGDNLSFF